MADVIATGEPGAVRCRGVVKRYGTVTAVDGLDLDVRRGECFGLLGPNGAGKTTTVEMLEGLLQPDGGTVEVLGCRWGHDDRALRARLGIQLQETQFSDKLSVEEVLRLFRSFYPAGRSVDELLALVDLTSKRSSWVSKLSGGQRQRLSVACALVNEPDLLFLDEPTTGLDPHSRRELWAVLEAYRARGGTILLTTHYMDEAETLCDRIAIVDRGKVIAVGTPRELILSLDAEHVVEFSCDGAVPADDRLAALPGVGAVRHEDGLTRLQVRALHRVMPALLDAIAASGATLSSLTTHQATLEDVFVTRTGRHLRDEQA